MSLQNKVDTEYLNIERICTRPHCAIRSHDHYHKTFAEYLNYSQHFCDVSKKYNLNDKDFINIYKSYKNNIVKSVAIIRDFLISIETEKDIELKKLKVLYIFSLVETSGFQRLTEKNKVLYDSIRECYNRILNETKDELFIEQLLRIYII